MQSVSIKKISILAQLLIFSGLLIVQCLPLYWGISFPYEFWIKQGLLYLVWIFIFYLNLKVLLPKVLFRGRNGLFFILTFVIVAAVLYVSNTIDAALNLNNLLIRHFKLAPKDIHKEGVLIADFGEIIITLLMIGCSTVISVARKLQMENEVRQNLEQEKIASELSFLKSQINPHFFFNILNSIYALTDESNIPAREAVYTLSHMMRYVLYDTKHNLTTLSKEVAFVEDYLKLMQLRLTDEVQVIFEKPSVLKEVPVAPMLFLPFVENAFKHGISSKHPSYIYIGIIQTGQRLQIEVRNSLFEEQPANKEESNGIGLVNTRRRLDLVYPEKYELSTIADTVQREYRVNLKLDIQ